MADGWLAAGLALNTSESGRALSPVIRWGSEDAQHALILSRRRSGRWVRVFYLRARV